MYRVNADSLEILILTNDEECEYITELNMSIHIL